MIERAGATVSTPIAYEDRLRSDRGWAMDEADRHLGGSGAVFAALRKIARRLDEIVVAYAVAGGMAVDAHGYRRLTVDVQVLVTREGLATLHRALDGLGYIPPFPGSRNLRDAEHGIRIEFLVAGEFPGDGRPKRVAFPDPAVASTRIGGLSYLDLPTLVELKLASGMTGGVARLKDLADVVAIVGTLGLDETFADRIDPSVSPKYLELLDGLRRPPDGPDTA